MKTILVAFLVFALLAQGAEAALQITSFSCNGQTGTVNAENGGTLVCQATVNNPDNAGASLSAATLYPTGSWVEDGSYAGSGFSTSINAGTSTTATFSGIRSTSSGLNAFGSIYLDSVRDTFVADTTINVVDFKSLTASSSASSASSGATVTINANALVGGNLDVAMSISVSGCSLKTGETSSKSLGSLSHNSAGSASWQVTMSTSTCSYTVTATGTKGAVSISTSKSGSIAGSGGGDDGDGGGNGGGSGGSSGGGGGGATTTTTSSTTTTTLAKKEASVSQANETEPAVFRFEDSSMAVTEITLNLLRTVRNATLIVSVAQAPSVQPVDPAKGAVYKYLSVEKKNINDNDIKSVKLRFNVDRSWISSNNLSADSVVLKRFESVRWSDLPTRKTGDTQSQFSYESDSPSLSVFAIVAFKPDIWEIQMQDLLVPIILVVVFVLAFTLWYVRNHHRL